MEDRLSSFKEQKNFYDMQLSVMQIVLENLKKSKDDAFNDLSEDFNNSSLLESRIDFCLNNSETEEIANELNIELI